MGLIHWAQNKRGHMRTSIKCIAVALMLGVSAGAASAAVSVGFDFGNVAIGYSDGYYDNGHHWHAWRHHADMQQWQREHADAYHGWRHSDKRHHD